MSKLIAVRLPEEIVWAIENKAAEDERTRSQVIIRILRDALTRPALETIPKDAELVYESLEGSPRYRKCQHGDNEYTCPRIACKLKTGRA